MTRVKREHKPNYKRCLKCNKRDKCKSMCVDVCCDEVNRIGETKRLREERILDQYCAKRASECGKYSVGYRNNASRF